MTFRPNTILAAAAVAAALADTLRERGVAEPTASMIADVGIAVFRNAFERWVTASDRPELTDLIRESLQALQAVTASA